jgi:hypothetical protein
MRLSIARSLGQSVSILEGGIDPINVSKVMDHNAWIAHLKQLKAEGKLLKEDENGNLVPDVPPSSSSSSSPLRDALERLENRD